MKFLQKQTIIKYYDEKCKIGRKFTQVELRDHFESEFKRKIGTISDIIKNRNKITAIDVETAKNKVRDRGAKFAYNGMLIKLFG